MAENRNTPAEFPPDMVVICNHGIADPLVSQLMLDYVRRMQSMSAGRRILFITEEPPGHKPVEGPYEQLLEHGIQWEPLRYDVQGRQWMQRLRNAWRMYRLARKFVRGRPNTWLVGYLSYGGAYAMLLNMLLRLRTAIICFEPHTEYMVELGIWRAGSLKARFMRWLEHQQVRRSDLLVVPTTAVQRYATRLGPRGRMMLQPIAINVGAALYDPEARVRLRDGAWSKEDVVFVYVGKFGGIYHSIDQYLSFLQRLFDGWARARALIIANERELDRIRGHVLYTSLQGRLRLQGPVPVERLHEHLSAADVGVLAVPPTPAQAYRTPVKTAHYWAAGLPILVPFGVSDDHVVASSEEVGVVVDDVTTAEADTLRAAYEHLLRDGVDALRERCIKAAWTHRDSGAMVSLLQSCLR